MSSIVSPLVSGRTKSSLFTFGSRLLTSTSSFLLESGDTRLSSGTFDCVFPVLPGLGLALVTRAS